MSMVSSLKGRINRVEKGCQAGRRDGRIIHHRQSLDPPLCFSTYNSTSVLIKNQEVWRDSVRSHQHLLAHPAVKYQFMAEHCGDSPVTVMCHVLEVSVSGDSAWHKREPSQHSREDAALAAKVETAFEHNRRVYGSPRIHALIACTRNSVWSKTCSSPHAGTGHLRSASQTSDRYDAQ